MPGYSGTPLARKLGLKAGHRVALLNAPVGIEQRLDGLPDDVALARRLLRSGGVDVIICFVKSRHESMKHLVAALGKMPWDGALWIAWPKKASKVPTDVNEDVIRDIALPTGLVDNKVCAIDETWSGLRLMFRKELRPRSNT